MRKWIISFVVIAFLIGLGSFAWTVYRGVSGLVGAITAIDDPVIEMHEAMSGNRIDEAYGYLAQDLQAVVSPGDFEREFRARNIWGDAGTFSFNSREIAGKLARIKGSYIRADGSVLPVFIQLVKERGAWKISRFNFGAPAPGQKEWEI